MRKVLKAALCLGLSLSLGFSTVAFGAEKKESVKGTVTELEGNSKTASKKIQSKGKIAAKALKTEYKDYGTAKVLYTQNDENNLNRYVVESLKAGSTKNFRLTIPKDGTYLVGVGFSQDNGTSYVFGQVTLKGVNGKDYSTSCGSEGGTIKLYGVKRGTYTLELKPSYDSDAVVIPYGYSSSQESLTGSERIFTGNRGNVYRTFSVKKRSQVWVDSYAGSGYTVCSYLQKKSGSKWTTISDKEYSNSRNIRKYYAVSKGSYRVVFCNTLQSQMYVARYGKKAYTGKYGTKKSKAKSIKRKKSKTNVLTASDAKKKTHWYKFKVTKRRSTQFKITTYNSSGSVTATLYKGKKKISSRTAYNPSYITFSGKLSKGTYYVKVTKNTKNTSGKYIVKYVK